LLRRPLSDDPVSEILASRDGSPTEALLSDGRRIIIHNIAWGRDAGDVRDHITTNISPSPSVVHSIDFFRTEEVTLLVDPASGAVLYRGGADG
jgi:hypothetical protein